VSGGIAVNNMTDHETKRTIIKSVRMSPRELDLIGAECRTGNIGFSEFVLAAVMAAATQRHSVKTASPRSD
jgi:hypothetical protein